MAAKCHFAHGKEDLRNVHDTLPANTPYISDTKTDPQPTNKPAFGVQNPNTKGISTSKYYSKFLNILF